MLLMKKEFFDAIRRGRKTTTLRYWRWLHIRAGSVHTVRGLGKVRIEAAHEIAPADLTDADARADGFADLASLHRTLQEIYPPTKREGRKLYQIRFTYLPGPDLEAAGAS